MQRGAKENFILLVLFLVLAAALLVVTTAILIGLAFDERLASMWLAITAVPYYFLYAVDLRSIGYRWRDVLRVYALNLLLIPVHLGGVLRSVQQACTGRRSTFGRTPKVVGRTAAPAGYVLAEAGLLGWWTFGALMELEAGHRLNGLFALANAAFLLYALVRFVGLREACEDLRPLVAQTAHGLGTLRLASACRRFVAPLIVVLALLFPSAVTGTELAI